MTFADILIDSLNRSRERLDRALAGVSVEQANTQPAPQTAPRTDSLTWLAWHTAREIDLQVSVLAGTTPLWFARYSARFALDLPDDTQDWRHSPSEAAKVTVDDLALLREYLDDAYALAVGFLRGLDESRLGEIVDDSWDPPVTLGARLVSIVDDAAQHSGQAIYTRRLLGLEG
ncbi:MAG: DUF664 domain-containing protein [Actinomycetaceae bacterium]|nr:DUF664 domain-containing protein [Actinomycetaceae bacterium]